MSQLIVFEGPDGVGKTTICEKLTDRLIDSGINVKSLSFPGNRDGTLGKFIHDFHHKHDKYGIKNLSSTSLQLLHVAAHFDTIKEDIIPALKRNEIVLLDRYWWSTYVYGKISGIEDEVLNKIMEIEDLAWKELSPDIIFLLSNQKPIGVPKTEKWIQLRDGYMNLAENQSNTQNVKYIDNERSIEQTLQEIIGILDLNCNLS